MRKYNRHIHLDSVHRLVARDDRPTREDIIDQMKKRGQVIGSGRLPAFYTRLNLGEGSISKCKCWMNDHKDLIDGSSAAVMFDELVPDDWNTQIATTLLGETNGPQLLNSYQKFLSQIFAEQASGTAWIFAPADLNFDDLSDDPLNIDTNTFWFWEYPALTQNANIDNIIRVDPFDEKDPPTTSTIWKQGDPTRAPKGLVDLNPRPSMSSSSSSTTSDAAVVSTPAAISTPANVTSLANISTPAAKLRPRADCSEDVSPDYPFVVGDNGPEPTLRKTSSSTSTATETPAPTA